MNNLAVWAALILIAIAAAVGLFATGRRWRFQRKVGKQLRALLALPKAEPGVGPTEELPPIAQRYRDLAVPPGPAPRNVRVIHSGGYREDPRAGLVLFRGTQLITSDPPGFVWYAQAPLPPALWFDTYESCIAGASRVEVLTASLVYSLQAEGPPIDQGRVVRLLAELVWCPSVLFDPRYVEWNPVDEQQARVVLRVNGRRVSALFHFGENGLPESVVAQRFPEAGAMARWEVSCRNYRDVAGFQVPFELEFSWQREDGAYTYATRQVESLQFNAD